MAHRSMGTRGTEISQVRLSSLNDARRVFSYSGTSIIKPIVGILFAVAIEGSRIAIVGTIVKAKMSGDERIKKAEENEKRRLSGSKSFGGR